MLVVLDSNILLSALISPHGAPAKIYEEWISGRFEVVTCSEQIEEIRRASRYPKLKNILKPHLVGKMLNTLQNTQFVSELHGKHLAADPHDAYLLNLADNASAHYLVTGDKKAGLLQLKRVGTARIMKASHFSKTVLGVRVDD
jgi:putative PIN family toxin of toxin-antitoxin system